MRSIRELLRERFPISRPEQAPLDFEALADARALSMAFDPLVLLPDLSSDIGAIHVPGSQSVDVLVATGCKALAVEFQTSLCTDSVFVSLNSLEQVDLDIGMLQYAGSTDLLVPLERPRRDGKVYEDGEPEAAHQLPLPNTSLEKRCKHGMPEGTCALCQQQAEAREKVAPSRLVTVDVFDLLLPLLYPPIGPDCPMAVVFPADKKPYAYQFEGIEFLKNRTAALLGDEMGLGKTMQAVVAMRVLIRNRHIRRALILCPRSLLDTWEEKGLREWAPELSVQRVRGTPEERKMLWRSEAHVLLTTYEMLRTDIRTLPFLTRRFDLVVLDEIQRIKNTESDTSQACRRLEAKYRWGLSGTPLENSIDDVAAIFSFLKPDLFRGASNPSGLTGLRDTIRPYFLRRRAQDVLKELPEKVSEEIWLELADDQRKAYALAESRGVADLERRTATRVHVFSLINELKQICNFDERSGTSCKLEYLLDQLGNVVESSEKALVFSHYPVKSLAAIRPRLECFSPDLFDGSLSDEARKKLVADFGADGPPHVLLMSVKAGGVGLDLQRANHAFHYDHWWNPAVANQATGRAHRLGQTRTVFVWHLYTKDTIEERIYHLLARKQQLFDMVIDDLSEESFREAVTDEELFGLFNLRPPRASAPMVTTSVSIARHDSTVEHISALSPRAFEELVAALYEKHGYSVELTPFTRDGGIDAVARQSSLLEIGACLLIQCKHTPESNVGAPVIRQLVGALAEHHDATGAAVVTSGGFTAEAREVARQQKVRLIDGSQLRDELVKAGLLPRQER